MAIGLNSFICKRPFFTHIILAGEKPIRRPQASAGGASKEKHILGPGPLVLGSGKAALLEWLLRLSFVS